MVNLTFVILSLFVSLVYCGSSYVGAVYSHVPISLAPVPIPSVPEAQAMMLRNLDIYEIQIELASHAGVDIIVFPEDGLTSDDKCTRDQILPYLEVIPDPRDYTELINPCNDVSFEDRPVLRRVSCMAKKNRIYTVIDMGDLQVCYGEPDCPEDGRWQFNAQVAFDRDGNLIGRYHKTHLFYEPQYDEPKEVDPVVFETDFGVRFGMMICFDMMFGTPTFNYKELGVNDIVYSTWWVNTPPYFSAIQWQQAWSATFGMTVLAAGNGGNWRYSGQGIFSSGSILADQFNPTNYNQSKLLIADVPITKKISRRYQETQKSAASISDRDPKLSFIVKEQIHCPKSPDNQLIKEDRGVMNFTPFVAYANLEATYQSVSKDLVCTAKFKLSATAPSEIYTVMSYVGQYDIETDYYHERFCAVYKCLNWDDCYKTPILNTMTSFEWFELSGNYPLNNTMFTLSSTNEGQLFNQGTTELIRNSETVTLYSSKSFTPSTVLNFSLLGRALSKK